MNVVIPKQFFLEEAKKEYSDISFRLVAELIQNSYDAGATEIYLDFDNEGYSCQDNGKGMSREAMISSMLTLGGSQKSAGSTGGFGAAKKIILFAHKSFEIHSNNVKAVGAGLNYDFVDCEEIHGTKISCKFFDESSFSGLKCAAERFLSKSRLKNCTVFINDFEFDNWQEFGEDLESTNIWDAYAAEGGYCWVDVYHNGLYMFDRYVGDIKKHIILNVKAPSTQVFSQNRQGFIGNAAVQFDDFCKKIITNPNIGFQRNFKTIIFKGIKQFIEKIISQEEVQDDFAGVKLTDDDVNQIHDIVIRQPEINDRNTLIAALNNSGYKEAAGKISHIDNKYFKNNYDFYVSIDENEDESKYIKLIDDPKYKFIASLYKVCINEVMRIDNNITNFYIGFCFDEIDTTLSKRDNKYNVFYINPKEFINNDNFKEMCCKILARAMHEYVHIDFQGHNDEYASRLTNLTEKVFLNAISYDELVEKALTEQNKNI